MRKTALHRQLPVWMALLLLLMQQLGLQHRLSHLTGDLTTLRAPATAATLDGMAPGAGMQAASPTPPFAPPFAQPLTPPAAVPAAAPAAAALAAAQPAPGTPFLGELPNGAEPGLQACMLCLAHAGVGPALLPAPPLLVASDATPARPRPAAVRRGEPRRLAYWARGPPLSLS